MKDNIDSLDDLLWKFLPCKAPSKCGWALNGKCMCGMSNKRTELKQAIKDYFSRESSKREAEIRNARIEGWLAGKGIHASELTLHDVEEAELIDEITANTYPHYKPFIEKLKLESGTADTKLREG